MLDTFITIIALSFIGAITPGPLFTLILTETLKHGRRNGIKIALAPLITDLPIMLLSLFVLSKLVHLNLILGAISFLGACYLIYLAYGSIKTTEVHLNKPSSGRKSLIKGIIANFLNPNPYIFYFSILSPLAIKGMQINIWFGPLSVFLFLGVFVFFMIILVLSIHHIRKFLSSKKYVWTIRTLGFVLFYFALIFLRESFVYWELVK